MRRAVGETTMVEDVYIYVLGTLTANSKIEYTG